MAATTDGHSQATAPRLVVGGNADLVVHGYSTLREVLARHEPPRHVIAAGQLVASTSSSTRFGARLADQHGNTR